jgi:hypothetical protein
MWEEEKCTDGKPEAKIPWRRRKENIKIYVIKIRYVALTVLISLTTGERSHVLKTIVNLRVPEMRGISFLAEETFGS